MKTIFTLSRLLLRKTKLALKLCLVLQLTSLYAQQSNFSTIPAMPSEKEVVNNGLDLKKVATVSVEKIEELYLYTFEQQQLIDEQKEEIHELKKSLEVKRQLKINLEKRLEKIEK